MRLRLPCPSTGKQVTVRTCGTTVAPLGTNTQYTLTWVNRPLLYLGRNYKLPRKYGSHTCSCSCCCCCCCCCWILLFLNKYYCWASPTASPFISLKQNWCFCRNLSLGFSKTLRPQIERFVVVTLGSRRLAVYLSRFMFCFSNPLFYLSEGSFSWSKSPIFNFWNIRFIKQISHWASRASKRLPFT